MDAVPVREMPRDSTCIGTTRGDICFDMVGRRKDMVLRYCYCYENSLYLILYAQSATSTKDIF